MYTISPKSVKEFIDDNDIRLPRFQRKQTWNMKKNFLLAVSVFKDYPLGVCIINKTARANGMYDKWLLDGRQRRTAFTQMLENPENIYIWAKKYIGFKSNAQPSDIKEMFIQSINEYIEEETQEDVEDSEDSGSNSLDVYSTENDDSDDDSSNQVEESDPAYGVDEYDNDNISFLCDIILMCHGVKKNKTGFSRPFDFSKYFSNVEYYVTEDGVQKYDGEKLEVFIKSYIVAKLKKVASKADIDSFIDFTENRFKYKDEKSVSIKFRKFVKDNWAEIKERIIIVDRIESVLKMSQIGIIEISAAKSKDAQKIFNIINDGGTKLTAAEILSAKPQWNISVNNPSADLIEAGTELYRLFNIDFDGRIVRWDIPATFVRRLMKLNNSEIFFPPELSMDDTTTLGFKLLSGIFKNGITKDDIEDLSKQQNITWNQDVEVILNDYKTIFKFVSEFEYFRYFRMWRLDVKTLLSDAILIDFLVLLYRDYKNKGLPSTGGKAKKFQKNAFLLLDQLIYEYTCRQWRGSSDSRVKKSIESFGNPDLLTPLDLNKWNSLLHEIESTYSINGEKLASQKDLQAIVFHAFCMKQVSPADLHGGVDEKFEVDHIYPQALFDNSSMENKKSAPHALFNLSLLSKSLNTRKKEKALKDLSESDKDLVSEYTTIKKADFTKYSSIANYDSLRKHRMKWYKEAFNDCRNTIIDE